ncbi:unnamed protein product [Phaedon cochleariae]|uniref:Activating molecule in BECN1-regulated autophagy protein 1 n=1 Tax=Phaedon cochleariae TaxID=80249 RepID=A0A9N9X0P0_PHACE|nr:unnamed protein product [Phaedon cochleariae]
MEGVVGTQKIELARRSEVPTPRRMVVINMQRLRSPASGGGSSPDAPGTSGFRLRSAQDDLSESSLGRSEEGDTGQSNVDELLSNIRRTAEEEVRNRILPIIRSVPANDRPELIRLFENSREHVRMRFRRMYPCPRKFNRLPIDTTSDSSSSDDEQSTSNRLTRRNSEPSSPPRIAPPVEQSFSSTGASSSNPNVSASGSAAVRNFDTELEQLVTSILTEIERNETVEGRERTPDGNSQTAHAIPSLRPPTTNWTPPPYRPRPLLVPPEETTPPPSQNASPLPTSTAGSNLLFQEIIQLLQNRENGESPPNPSQSNVLSNTNTRTTNSTVYTTSSGGGLQLPPRRRFFSHRISAFMPTRVNYTRSPSPRLRRSPLQLYRGMRLGSIGLSNPTTFGLDELINYSELENSEDDPPPPPPPPDENHPADPTDPESDISSMYSNIVQELESSLENVVRLRVSTRPGETSNMLSSFSERLESILNQSSVILRNLTNSMEMLTTSTSTRRFNTVDMSEPNTWNYFDPTFYVRSSTPTPTTPPTPPTALPAPVSPPLPTAESPPLLAPPFDAVVADHTYPRHAPEGGAGREGGTPMVATVHLTILHIQRQARLLRQQVEVIEQIDRAMLEVEQLQLVRHLVVELVRHVRTTGGGAAEDTAPAAGSTNRAAMSSVRQMMAGTRISDSSPYDSPAEEGGASGSSTGPSSATSGTAAPSTSGNTPVEPQAGGSGNQTNRQRSSSRKTYPPSRMFRLAKQCRRPSVLHFFSRRNSSRADRGHRQNSQSRPANRNAPTTQDTSSNRFPPLTSIYSYDSNRLAVMTRRLEQLLTEQMRAFTSPDRPRAAAGASNRSTATIDLGEHILALRLHGCVLRMNRVLGYPIGDSRADPTAAVTRDGVSRYNARHLLSLVIDSVSRHVEELGQSDASASTRAQTHGVLAMSLLLTELLLLVVVDSIPPPSGIDFNPERGALASRIDQLCGQMLQNRQCTYSQQLTRSLRLMRLTMRHAHSALGQTYHARRNAMLPRHSTDRRLLLGSINRCLRTISRRRQTAPSNQSNTPAQDAAAAAAEEASTAAPSSSSSSSPAPANSAAAYNDWYSTISDLIGQYSTPNRDDDADNRPSTSGRDRVAAAQNDVSSNNDNSDDDDNLGYSLNTSSNLYRANNINLAPSSRESSSLSSTSRPWNVPSVHVNDVPVTEPTSSFAQRLMSQRQRAVADRMSELRSNQQPPGGGGGGGGLFRPRFLHPFYASVNPFDADLDDAHRDQVYDSDMVTTVTPNHRIQAWDVADWSVPNIGSPTRNVVVSECKIHNDASVDIAKDGTILVTLLPSGGYLNVTNRLGVYSLRWETLGQCLYTTSFEQNAVSVSLSPLGRHLVVGLASRIVPSDRWIMARVFKIEQKDEPGDRLPVVRELEQSRDSRINCIRWLPSSGQGLIYATNTGQLVVLT